MFARMVRRTVEDVDLPFLLVEHFAVGAITIVNGVPGFHFAPHAACSPATSAEANCLLGLDGVLFLQERQHRGRLIRRIGGDGHEIERAQAIHAVGGFEIEELARARGAVGRPEVHKQHFLVGVARSFFNSSAPTMSTVTGSA